MTWNFSAREEKDKIFVSKLSCEIENSTLRKTFETVIYNWLKYGVIKDLNVVRKSTTAYAFIIFDNEKSAQKSLEMHDQSIHGSTPISVAIYNPEKRVDPK